MLSSYFQLLTGSSIAGLVLILTLVGVLGITLGTIRIRGVALGLTGALFAGIVVGHFLWNEHQASWLVQAVGGAEQFHARDLFRNQTLDFLRDAGLLLFVYAMGLQAGPSFLASFRANGLKWNLGALLVVLFGFLIAVVVLKTSGMPAEAVVGIYSGAVTNVPGLSAAQQAITDVLGRGGVVAAGGSDPVKVSTSACAVAYPVGILGVIGVLIAIRFIFRIDPHADAKALAQETRASRPIPTAASLAVINPGIVGKTLKDLLALVGDDSVVSRLGRRGEVSVPTPDTVLEKDDFLLAVGTHADLDRLRAVVGGNADSDLRAVPGRLAVRRMIVTEDRATGRSPVQLQLTLKFGCTITRIERGGLEFVATDELELLIGDIITAVGSEDDLNRLGAWLGNSEKSLDKPRLQPLLLGILIGTLVGVVLIPLPGLPAPVKLGLAGGPMLVAILLCQLGRLGPFQFYVNHGALHFMKEFGITLFMACVGLKSGDVFFDIALSQTGLQWIACGAIITLVPIATMAFCLRSFFKANYAALCGVLSGATTNPPVLVFSNAAVGSELPGVAFASVYPLTMIMRIFLGQVFILLFF